MLENAQSSREQELINLIAKKKEGKIWEDKEYIIIYRNDT